MKKKIEFEVSDDSAAAKFERLRDFTRRLMAVPKKEIDAQKAKYEKHKAGRKKKAA